VKLLLESGASLESSDLDGFTPLMHAAVRGHAEVTCHPGDAFASLHVCFHRPPAARSLVRPPASVLPPSSCLFALDPLSSNYFVSHAWMSRRFPYSLVLEPHLTQAALTSAWPRLRLCKAIRSWLLSWILKCTSVPPRPHAKRQRMPRRQQTPLLPRGRLQTARVWLALSRPIAAAPLRFKCACLLRHRGVLSRPRR
jgi:hypothetical protein